jgi:hypothetical protein
VSAIVIGDQRVGFVVIAGYCYWFIVYYSFYYFLISNGIPAKDQKESTPIDQKQTEQTAMGYGNKDSAYILNYSVPLNQKSANNFLRNKPMISCDCFIYFLCIILYNHNLKVV